MVNMDRVFWTSLRRFMRVSMMLERSSRVSAVTLVMMS